MRPAVGLTRLVVLALPGGRVESLASLRPWHLSLARMTCFARGVHRKLGGSGVAVATLRYRVRGWNGPQASPIADARWALARLAEEFDGVPVVLLGHSMGGRSALRIADGPGVSAVVALAPWLPEGEPRAGLRGKRLLVVHGTADRWTDPAASRALVAQTAAEGVPAAWIPMPGHGHFMLRRPRAWRRHVTDFIAGLLDSAQDVSELASQRLSTSSDESSSSSERRTR